MNWIDLLYRKPKPRKLKTQEYQDIILEIIKYFEKKKEKELQPPEPSDDCEGIILKG